MYIVVGLNKGTRLIWRQWDLNLAGKWGQLLQMSPMTGNNI